MEYKLSKLYDLMFSVCSRNRYIEIGHRRMYYNKSDLNRYDEYVA